jgi:purine-binding chemotaxis protein CheW
VVTANARSAELTVARAGGLHVGFRLDAVQEVLMGATITPVPLAERGLAGLINVRGEILSVVDLVDRLGLDPENAERKNHVIVRTARGLVAVTVDQVTDVVHAPMEAYEEVQGSAADHFTGAYALPNRLVLVLDVDQVVWRDRDLSPA